MNNARKLAWQGEEIEKLRAENRALRAEIRTLELRLDSAGRQLEQERGQSKRLGESFERFLQGYSEKIEALEEAENRYQKATADTRSLQQRLEREAKAQIALMRRENGFLEN